MVRKKLTKKQKGFIKRIETSRKLELKARKNLKIATFRRKQAEKGNVLEALFGKPKSLKRKVTRRSKR